MSCLCIACVIVMFTCRYRLSGAVEVMAEQGAEHMASIVVAVTSEPGAQPMADVVEERTLEDSLG